MHLSIRNGLISFGFLVAGAFLGAFLMQNLAVRHLDLNGPVYRDINMHKELVADITPPSLLPTEAYALMYEAFFHSEYRAEDIVRIKSLETQYRQAVKKWKTMDLSAEESARLYKDVLPKVDAFWTSMNNDLIPVLGQSMNQIKPVADRFAEAYREQRHAVDMLSKETIAVLDQKVTSATGTMRFYTGLANLAGLAAALIFAVGLVAIARLVIGPLMTMTGYLSRISEGEFAIDIPYQDRKDEIGSVAKVIQALKLAQISKKNLETEIELNRIQAEKNRIADQKMTEAAAAERLQQATAGLANGLRLLASGKLNFQITKAFAPEFESLRNDFNASVLQLNEALGAVYESVASISNGTNEINVGVNDLSKRTETQASSLEQTVAAVGQITENVGITAKRAEVAQLVAVQANASATASGEVVSKAVEAMTRIEDSAKSIANIIGVIDDIAFQTNLLALNAGVEAARAGEAGRGFAVVAQEVRELAQRSALAAKEIKGLIKTSTSEVALGAKLVYETGQSLEVIGEQVNSINEHINVIAQASREQSIALAEVNTAINHFDQNTQMNASMVEESSAAAESLLSECTQLEMRVTKFQLGRTSPGQQSVYALKNKRREMEMVAEPVVTPRKRANAGFDF